MNNTGRNRKGVSGLQVIRLVFCNVDFQLALDNQKALIRVRMFMPTKFAFHDRQSNGMIVYVEDHKVLIDLLNGSRFLLQVDDR